MRAEGEEGLTIFRDERRVEFHEVDSAGIVHFARFFYWMEMAEHALVRSLGQSVMAPGVAWPRVHAQCDYERPLRFEETFVVEVSVLRRGRSSIRYGFVFRKQDGTVAARGETVAASVARQADGSMKAVPLPSWTEGLEVSQ